MRRQRRGAAPPGRDAGNGWEAARLLGGPSLDGARPAGFAASPPPGPARVRGEGVVERLAPTDGSLTRRAAKAPSISPEAAAARATSAT